METLAQWIYELVKGATSFVLDNWKGAIKAIVALYFITTGAAILAGPKLGLVGLPGMNMTIPMS